MTDEAFAGGNDPYGTRRTAATLALARQWDVPVRTASAVIESWACTLDVRVGQIADCVLDEIYSYWRRHGSPGAPRRG